MLGGKMFCTSDVLDSYLNVEYRAWCPSYEISSKRMLLQTTFSVSCFT